MTVSECAEALRTQDNFLILSHIRPDGDALGSAAALCHALRRAGKTAVMYANPQITEHFAAMTAPYTGMLSGGEYVVTVDVAGPEMFPLGIEGGSADLCIDHHPGEHTFAPLALVDHTKASCGEIVMQVIEALCGDLTPEEASLLYVALSTDCGCFVYGNTTAETHRNAARLIECGADYHRLNKELFRSFSFSRLKLEGMIFSSLRSYHDNQINVAVVTLDMMRESGATVDDCDDLASLAGKVRGNRVSITVRELEPGVSKGSVRTDGSVDANTVCARFGGGGHKMASGCTLDVGPEELAEKLVAVIEEFWPVTFS